MARGGGSVTDLLAFSDEMLCRTVALLPVPVVASIGHHSDRTLLDDVAAASCSTPTHAAEVAVPMDCNQARTALAHTASRLRRQANLAVVDRARRLGTLARAPAEHVARQRIRLDHAARDLGAASGRRVTQERQALARAAHQLARERDALCRELTIRRPAELERARIALSAHDPERTLLRGYALVEDPAGEPLTSAALAAEQTDVTLRFADGRLAARIAGREQ